MNPTLLDKSAREIAEAVKSGRTTARSITLAALERVSRIECTNAFFRSDRDAALSAADAVDSTIRVGGDPGPLAGVPIAIKDNLVEKGQPCTCGSRILEGYVAPYDAHAVALLRAAGAVTIGRTNMDEFAMGSSSENSAWGPVRNPWAQDRVPGGSSAGSAVAVAAGVVPVALGSDTGGSVRQPAAFTGTVGLKPTYGRVSRRGLVAFASSFDQIGPLGRNVRDVAFVLAAISGRDAGDSTSGDQPVLNWLDACERPVKGLRLGLPREFFGEGLDPSVAKGTRDALAALENAGATLVELSLPSAELAVACYYVLAPAEASANLARFDGIRYGLRVPGASPSLVQERTRSAGFGDEVKRRILIGTWVLSAGYVDAYYRTAQRVRARITRELCEALDHVDAILSPTAPTPAFRIGEKSDPLQMYLSDTYTIPASLAGLPAISVPCGLADGLPLGLQIMARHWDESMCFRIAAAVEGLLGLSPRPPLWTG